MSGLFVEALPDLEGGDAVRAVSCGTSVASCFTGNGQGQPWSYIASAGVEPVPTSQGQDIDGRVHVPVMHDTARRAPPHADMERLGAVLEPARRAHPAGGLPPACPAEAAAMPAGLVFQHGGERRPPRIMHRLRQRRNENSRPVSVRLRTLGVAA